MKNALKTFKEHGAKMLAMTALFTTVGSLAANAQAKPKADTIKVKEVVSPTKLISDTTDANGVRMQKFSGKSELQRKAASNDVKTTSVPTTVKPSTPVTPKKLMPDADWIQFLKDHPNWTAPKKNKETAAPTKEKTVEKNTSEYHDKTVYVYDSTVVILPPLPAQPQKPDTVQIKPIVEKRPWRISIGPVWHNRFNAAVDPNAAGAATAPTRKANIDPTEQPGYYVRATSSKFGKRGSFLGLFEGEVEAQIFPHKNKKLPFLMQQGYSEIDPGAGSNSEVFDVTASRSKLRNNARASIKFAPTIGKGHVKVEPYLQGGGFFQEKADVEIVEFPDPVTGVVQAPTRMTPETKQILKQNQASLFYAAGISIFGDVGKPKTKDSVKKDKGLYFTANANVFSTTQSAGIGTMYTGFTHGGKYQWNVSAGVGIRF